MGSIVLAWSSALPVQISAIKYTELKKEE